MSALGEVGFLRRQSESIQHPLDSMLLYITCQFSKSFFSGTYESSSDEVGSDRKWPESVQFLRKPITGYVICLSSKEFFFQNYVSSSGSLGSVRELNGIRILENLLVDTSLEVPGLLSGFETNLETMGKVGDGEFSMVSDTRIFPESIGTSLA